MSLSDPYISHSTAILAKAKGFFLPIDSENKYFAENGNIHDFKWFHLVELQNPTVAVTQSLLNKWLRDVHKLYVIPQNVNVPTLGKWMYEIHKLPCGVLVLWNVNKSPNFDTYEEALEVGLCEALNSIKN